MTQSNNNQANLMPGGVGPMGRRPAGSGETPAEIETPAGKGRGGRRFIVLPIILVILLAVAYFGYQYMQEQAKYVVTENALVTGAMVQAGSLNAGQVANVAVDLGDRVVKGQTVATIALPSSLGTTAGGTPKIGFRGTDDQQVSVISPIDGVVVSRQCNPGDTVAAGQPLVTIVDPSQLWVLAQIEETKVARVRPGQPVAVHVDALGQEIPGRVLAINRATAGTFSLLPQGNNTGNYNKVTQVIPVKIAIDYGQQSLVLGSSVGVKIAVEN